MAVLHRAPADAPSHPPEPAIGFSLGRYHGWQIELDLRSLKSAMQMGELRGKTPEMVRKEVWAHVLGYNLIRTVMAQAGARLGTLPRSISFTGGRQALEAFQPLLALGAARN